MNRLLTSPHYHVEEGWCPGEKAANMTDTYPSVLLETIAGRLDQSVGLTRLQHVLGASLKELQDMAEDFSATVGQLPDYARHAVRAEVQGVEGAVDAYRALLQAAQRDPGDEKLAELQEAFAQAAEELNVATLAFREAALAERGPTAHAGLNLLLLGAVRPQDIELLQAQATAAARQLAHSQPNELTGELQAFHQDYAALLAIAADLPPEELEPRCQELGCRYGRIDVAGLTRRLSAQPTPLPAINLVLNGKRLEGEGHVAPEVLAMFLAAARQQLVDSRHRHAELQEVAGDNKLHARLEAAYERLEKALEGEPAELEKAAHLIGSIWLAMGATAEEERGRVDTKDTAEEGQTTVRAERLLAQAELVLSGGDETPLLTLVEEMERGRRQADAQLERLSARLGAFPPEEQQRAREAAELFELGIQDLGQSLEHFRELARTRSRALLRPAAETLWNALDRIFEVQHRLRPYV